MSVWKRLFIPLPIDLLIFLTLWTTKVFIIGWSFLLGALICWFGEFCFTVILAWKIKRKKPNGFTSLLILAEMVKLMVFAFLFVMAVKVFRLHVFPTFMGFVLNLIFYWILSLKALGDN